MESLESLLVKSAIILNYPAEDAADIVGILGDRLFDAGYTEESFIQAALDRENKMPTGLPLNGRYNAAIPHTDIEHVKKPGVAFATLKSPVTFRNMAMPDELVQVSLVFLLALDKPKAQISMLQEIAGILQDSQLIEDLMNTSNGEEVIRIIRKKQENN